MPNLLVSLEVDRIDLVDEGANSEAFIKLYKRKERTEPMTLEEILKGLKPEHAEVVQAEITKAKAEVPEEVTTELSKAKEDAKVATDELEELKKAKPATPDAEDIIKSLDPAVQEVFKSLKAQKEAAEEVLKQNELARVQSEAVVKAKELKALPVEEAKLVEVMKSITPELFEVLKAASEAIENGALLDEVGKGKGGEGNGDAWSQIEKKADEIAKAESLTKAAAIRKAIKDNPELYRDYLNGGAN